MTEEACTTRSWSARAAPVRQQRCCSRAAATACSCATAGAFRATRCRTGRSTRRGRCTLKRWRLLDRLVATGVPPITFGITHANGCDHRRDYGYPMYAPMRRVLDDLLVAAAIEAGVELRQRFRVSSVVVEDGRVTGVQGVEHDHDVMEHARIVVGADGRYSTIAREVRAREVRPRSHGRRRRLHVLRGCRCRRFRVLDRRGRMGDGGALERRIDARGHLCLLPRARDGAGAWPRPDRHPSGALRARAQRLP